MKILERFRKTDSLRISVFIPLILAFILLLGSMALILEHSQKEVLRQELAAKTKESERLFLEYRFEEAKTLSLALSTLTLNKDLMSAFKARDRKRLHDMTKSYFEQLRSNYDVTHLYFTGPDRVNILRLHEPDRYGDRIDRFTTLEAEKTGRESQGVELGPLGTLTLRVVTPWYEGERLLGYVELGMEVEHILKELQEILDSRVFIFINKDFIQRKGWEAGIRMLGHKEEWGHFSDTVIAGEPLDRVPENVAQLIAGKQTLQSATDIHINGTYYQSAFIPLIDAGKREIGHISVLLDTTARVSAFHRSVLLIGIFYVLVGAALFVFFYALLGQIEKRQNEDGEHIRQSEARYRKLNEELEAIVWERTKLFRDAQKELVYKEKLSVLGQLSGSLGHELRNPLGVMSNAVYYLKTAMSGADENVKEYLNIIKSEIDNSQRIISDLLGFARTNAPQIKAVTARELIDESLGRCAIPNNVELHNKLPQALPLLKVDPLQMGQVFQNLITNGVQAKGIGLGLVVCKNLVEANGGRLEVESELGKGTTFTVLLPTDNGGEV